ncbi:transglycosylase domain-containing protein [Streptomyces sp. MI02-7b]|uniref:transglycosylase domain-containing protein n=1 Tax=Streptomyces sp. MI02-7b TaxID=462941 RepID=UPI0029A7F661|nr:transglycosylase domain-containing protein [Streptomyces sp. MI02-7b]MDX3076384.1 transglycosylase domain-containing protein [Streptomyces sp. MI02-7b]
MSEHRRKPPQTPPGGGRAAARRGAQQQPPPGGRREAPPSQSYGTRGAGPAQGAGGGPRQQPRRDGAVPGQGQGGRPPGAGQGARGSAGHGAVPGAGQGGRRGGGEPPYQGRAAARRAAQSTQKGGRRRTAGAGAGAGGGRGGGQPPKKRILDYPRWGRDGWQRWVPSWKLVSGLCVFFFGSLVAAAGIGYAMVGIPNENDAAKSQNNVFYWANGDRMVATGTGANRQNVTLAEIPKSMQYAVISAENKTFEKDSGVDPMGIGRALFNMAKGGDAQGGSTITQQYVKNTYLSQDQTVSRKFKELFISIKVGTKLKKDQILQGYLNTSYYGRGAYGIQAAAQTYYGRDAEKLTDSQCAFLAALLKGPTYYDPAGNVSIDKIATPEANRKNSEDRWRWILGEMYKDGHLTKDQYDKAVAKYPMPQGLKATKGMTGQISYLVDTAKNYVLSHSKISRAELDQGGYQIYTTFEKPKVDALSRAVQEVEQDNLDPKKREKDKYVQFGAASVKPNDGAIVAIYGGPGFENNHFTNNANTSGVPVGSTWKPFVLAAAMEYGTYRSHGEGISPLSKYNGNDHLRVKNNDGTDVLKKDNTPFYQENESDYPWGYITLRKAMEQSINTPFVQLGMDVGMDKVASVAEKAGILKESLAGRNASFALGTSTPSAVRMADAYATFAASGKHTEPYSVTSVKQGGVEVPGFDKPKATEAMPSEVADNVTDVLQNVIQKGTGMKALALGRAAAGKTGTTDSNKSAWFVGYTQQLSTSIAMFRENPKTHSLLSMNGTAGVASIHGGDIPTQVWTEYMKSALKGTQDTGFPKPVKIGDIHDELGAPVSPSPSVSASPTQSASSTPTPTFTKPTPTLTPTPTDTCKAWLGCQDPGNGGNNNGGGGNNGGGDNGGGPGGGLPSDSSSPSVSSSSTKGTGLFQGPNG